MNIVLRNDLDNFPNESRKCELRSSIKTLHILNVCSS